MKKLIKIFQIYILTLSLIHTPLVFGMNSLDDITDAIPAAVNNNSHLITPALQMLNGITQQMLQSSQQLNQANRSTSLINSLQPKTIPARYFGHCKIPQVRTNFPKNACKKPLIPGQGNIQEARLLKNLGLNYNDYFEQFLTKGQNTRTPVGLQCLEDGKTQVLSSIKDRINNLDFWISKIKKESQDFTKNNEQELEKMRNLNGILTGASGETTIEQNRNFRDYFPSNECQTIIGQDSLGGAGGLIGIRKSMEPVKSLTNNYTANKAVYEHDLDNEIKRISSDIETNGVGAISLTKGITGRTQFAGVTDAIEKRVQLLTRERELVTKELANLDPNFKIPELDQNFGIDFAEFTKGAEEHFRLSYINKCATLEEFGVGINTNQILKSLEQRSTDSKGTTHINYIIGVKNILGTTDGSNNFMSNKLAELKKLENLYGSSDLTISYQNDQAVHVNETVYELFSKIVSTCEKKYKQTNIFAEAGSKSISQFKQIKRGIEKLNDLVKEEKNFTALLANQIVDQVLNCEGRKMNARTCDASGGLYDTSNAGFCIKHATVCADRVNACYSKAKNTVTKIQVQKKNIATLYNEKVKTMLKRHDKYLETIGSQVIADAQYLKQYFPGSDFDIPKDFYIKQETKEEKLNGESILGGGKSDFSGSLVEQVTKLKGLLEGQSSKITAKIDQYIGEQNQAMEVNKQKWAELTQKCESTEEAILLQQLAAKQAAEKSIAAQNQQVGEFCQKYGRFKGANPASGCGGDTDLSPEDLYGDIGKVVHFVSLDVEYNVNAYAQVCAAYNNERDQDSEPNEEDDENKVSKLSILCANNDNDSELVKAELLDGVKDSLSDNLRNDKRVKEYLRNGGAMPKILKGTPEGKMLKLFNNAFHVASVTPPDTLIANMNTELSNLQDKKEEFGSNCQDEKKNNTACNRKIEGLQDKQDILENKIKYFTLLNKSKLSKFKTADNFCHARHLVAAKKALDSCDKDCNANTIEEKYNEEKTKDTGASRSINRAIASAEKNSFVKRWNEIGERQKLGYCDANDQRQRQMQFNQFGQGGIEDMMKLFKGGGQSFEQ